MPSIKAQIIEIINKIPSGKVMYFGQIGKLIVNKNFDSNDNLKQSESAKGMTTKLAEVQFTGVSGQVVGFVLSGMPSLEWNLLPWHRVVAKDGYISSLKLGAKGLIQKQLLLDEKVEITEDRVDMTKHLFEDSGADFLF
jgi:alkylated DNA nucleotide flippase Atl1